MSERPSSRPRRVALILDGVAERASIDGDPSVSRHDCDERGRFAEQLGGGEVNCIERPEGFDRESGRDTREDGRSDVDDEPPTFDVTERSHRGLLGRQRQSAGDGRTYDRTRSFGQCQSGRRAPVGVDGRTGGFVPFE